VVITIIDKWGNPTRGVAAEKNLLFDPIKDMHHVEEFENMLVKLGISHFVVECRKITRRGDVFLGWSICTAEKIYSEAKQ